MDFKPEFCKASEERAQRKKGFDAPKMEKLLSPNQTALRGKKEYYFRVWGRSGQGGNASDLQKPIEKLAHKRPVAGPRAELHFCLRPHHHRQKKRRKLERQNEFDIGRALWWSMHISWIWTFILQLQSTRKQRREIEWELEVGRGGCGVTYFKKQFLIE